MTPLPARLDPSVTPKNGVTLPLTAQRLDVVVVKLVCLNVGASETQSSLIALTQHRSQAEARVRTLIRQLKRLGFSSYTPRAHPSYMAYRPPESLQSTVQWVAFDLERLSDPKDPDMLTAVLDKVTGPARVLGSLNAWATDYPQLRQGLLDLDKAGEDDLNEAVLANWQRCPPP